MEDNEVADDWAKEAAESTDVAVDRPCLREPGLAHMTGAATEAKTHGTKGWTRNNVNRRRGYKPLKETSPERASKASEKALASRYCQHAATGVYLCSRMGRGPSDKCWRCGRSGEQTRYHPLVRCEGGATQSKALWESAGKACGWKHPKVPRIRVLEEKADPAVLNFLRRTRAGEMVSLAALGVRRRRVETSPAEEEGEQGGRAP